MIPCWRPPGFALDPKCLSCDDPTSNCAGGLASDDAKVLVICSLTRTHLLHESTELRMASFHKYKKLLETLCENLELEVSQYALVQRDVGELDPEDAPEFLMARMGLFSAEEIESFVLHVSLTPKVQLPAIKVVCSLRWVGQADELLVLRISRFTRFRQVLEETCDTLDFHTREYSLVHLDPVSANSTVLPLVLSADALLGRLGLFTDQEIASCTLRVSLVPKQMLVSYRA